MPFASDLAAASFSAPTAWVVKRRSRRIIVAVASGEAQADRPSWPELGEWASDVGCNSSRPVLFQNENPGQVAAAGRVSASDIRLAAILLAPKFKPTA